MTSFEPMESSALPVPDEPKNVTLKEAIDRDGVPPAPSSKQRRLMDVHVTAYPSLVNTSMLPNHKTAVKDFSSIDPLKYRKEHAIRNNNAASYSEKEDNVLDMLSTNQFANRMTQIGVQMRADRIENPDSVPAAKSFHPRGYHSRFLHPPFDERSTYRWDYCQEDVEGLHDTARRSQLATYRDEWTENEKSDVDASMKVPYLTQPVSSDRLMDKATVYRKDFMPEATHEEFRLLTHKTDLGDLGTTFAYSGYGVDDPRRQVPFDAAVASTKGMHSVVEKSFSPRATYAAKKAVVAPSAKEELEQLRAMQRETMRRTVSNNHASCTAARAMMGSTERALSGSTDSKATPVVIPGLKGTGYRRAPKDNDDYVCLPRDHFRYQVVDNF
ncbi:hypothetical protein ABB37_05211 [Leptomonas pyrrhocoris]|uniref:Uncharacterized protein n=1 Tax=Leptomonas pyrrhocoris TaxID=157538 RepID=A0A0M9G1C9_LEPPY|nr:hypothetical protein ABB37_05211 [Leptomonas pyrrhocoris]KPA80243.1 hypothetical protein ABB37_05211 [Leptomonas pyrrhocoris]|eukprot:XP_015658682.1 hypothetical protein ABB37_05211 [Leptomonas pyrrhocoris]